MLEKNFVELPKIVLRVAETNLLLQTLQSFFLKFSNFLRS